MKKIILSLAIIVTTASLVAIGGTGAFFSDTETSSGNTFMAGEIDLKVDNQSYYNGLVSSSTSWSLADLTIEKFFYFLDLKPGDYGEDTISLHVDTNDAYLCADVTLTSNEENNINEPEGGDGDATSGAGQGELASNVNFIWWADDGDNVLESDEGVISQGPIGALTLGVPATITLADSQSNIWTGVGGPVPGNDTLYIGKAWCFGALTLSPLAQDALGTTSPRTPANSTGGISCNGSLLDNTTQTDSLTADVTFEAVQARSNASFVCTPLPPPPTITACEVSATQKWADSLVVFNQGRRRDGTSILPERSVASASLGPAETTGVDSDEGFPIGSFVSLGFETGTTSSRSIVLSFDDNLIVNEAGPDLKIYEVTGGVYQDERVKVEASKDGISWTLIAANAIRDEALDLGPLDWARYVRITDINDSTLFEAEADGYDLDAVEALNCGQPVIQQVQ